MVNKVKLVDPTELRSKYGNTIVLALVGNMGQGVTYAVCINVALDQAPETKLDDMQSAYGSTSTIVKVPFGHGWEILQTGDTVPKVR